ncbi:MAG: DUF2249 domain-containing protein [Candidatus Dormibacteraceae bacterium]
MKDLEFDERIEWKGAGREAGGILHTGGQAIPCSVPRSMGGKGEGTSPEDLLVSAVANCYVATLAALASRGGVPVDSIEVAAGGTVAGFPDQARIAEIRVSPTFVGADASRRPEYESLARDARERCFVGRHLASQVAYRLGEVGFAPAPAEEEAGALDVRPLPPARRHELIFERLDGLSVGQALTLVNDHDPAPLRYQLEATRDGGYRWDYLQRGPEVWQVRIGRET